MRILTLAATPAHSKSILGYDLFYTASATAGNLSSRLRRGGRHCTGERSGLTETRGCLFGFVRKRTAHAGEINGEKSSQRAPPFFLYKVYVYVCVCVAAGV